MVAVKEDGTHSVISLAANVETDISDYVMAWCSTGSTPSSATVVLS